MKKQEILDEILLKLSIPSDPKFKSEGSTITKDGIIEIMTKLSNSDTLTKHKLFKALCFGLDIPINNAWFSTGSTITKDGWQQILNKL